MAFSPADIEQFIEAVQADPSLRDRVRDAILHADFLALRAIAERLAVQDGAMPTRTTSISEAPVQLTSY